MKNRWIFRGAAFLLMMIAAAFLLAFVVMSLWNWLVPALFARPAITFWQALGLLILSKILLGGLRFGHRGGGYWRRRMKERWEQMTPDEREAFRRNMRGRCGWPTKPIEEA
jgi:hypothetical protein